MSRISTRLWIPVIGSFAVYLVPLVGPHAIWLVGESLAQGVAASDGPNPWWLAANVAFAFAAQIATGLLLAWTTRGSRLRLLTWVPMVPALVAGMNVAYLVRIPSYFLIEPDTAQERTNWTEHCFVADAALMSIRTSVTQRAAGVREWWMSRPDARYALLRLPDCALVEAAVPVPALQPGGRVDFSLGFQFAAPGGAAILERVVLATPARSWWLLPAPSAPMIPIERPELAQGSPILSDGADALAWIERGGDAPPYPERVAIRELQASDGFTPHLIDLERFGRASYTLLGVDTVAREVVLWRNDAPVRVGFDGDRGQLGFTPGAIRAQPSTYLRTHDGWVAWDAYRDEGPYQLAWSLAGRSGMHRTNNGRSITAAAVDPTGSFIAISETTTLSIGNARDVVYVIRASDGSDVFRRYLPRYARSQVVFFEGGLFAYSDLAGTHVLAIRP
jgi:hypothetical protein